MAAALDTAAAIPPSFQRTTICAFLTQSRRGTLRRVQGLICALPWTAPPEIRTVRPSGGSGPLERRACPPKRRPSPPGLRRAPPRRPGHPPLEPKRSPGKGRGSETRGSRSPFRSKPSPAPAGNSPFRGSRPEIGGIGSLLHTPAHGRIPWSRRGLDNAQDHPYSMHMTLAWQG